MPCECPCNRGTPGEQGAPRNAGWARCACNACGHYQCHVRIPPRSSNIFCWMCKEHRARQRPPRYCAICNAEYLGDGLCASGNECERAQHRGSRSRASRGVRPLAAPVDFRYLSGLPVPGAVEAKECVSFSAARNIISVHCKVGSPRNVMFLRSGSILRIEDDAAWPEVGSVVHVVLCDKWLDYLDKQTGRQYWHRFGRNMSQWERPVETESDDDAVVAEGR